MACFNNTPMPDEQAETRQAEQVLTAAFAEICQLASETGIDGASLLRHLPHQGLIKGQEVPVLAKRYRGACYVLFYINRLRNGHSWPFLRFYTFKDGGIERNFNGLRWQRQRGKPVLKSIPATPPHSVSVAPISDLPIIRAQQIQEAHYRQQRHQHLLDHYQRSQPLNPDHPWVIRRLAGHANAGLLARCTLRSQYNRLLMPIQQDTGICIGFHQIVTDPSGDHKRHFVQAGGQLSGSFGLIKAAPGHEHDRPMLCEGVATGLTLALAWPGPIRIALSANNLAPVRAAMTDQSVIICHDNDLYKPTVGNVGKRAAEKARQPGDYCIGPTFSPAHRSYRPTDFNDLLHHHGKDSLQTQLAPVWRRLGT